MSEAKFVSLRKRLDQLGYRQSLGVDSVPLAERLLGDLLHTTESLKEVRLQLGQHKQQKVTALRTVARLTVDYLALEGNLSAVCFKRVYGVCGPVALVGDLGAERGAVQSGQRSTCAGEQPAAPGADEG